MSDNSTIASLRTLRSNASNIQSMLRLASDGYNTFKILDNIIPTIWSHFERVEALDINVSEEGKEDHRALLELIKVKEADWRKKKLSDADYTEVLRFKLFNHFTMFFVPLLDAVLEEGSLSGFRL